MTPSRLFMLALWAVCCFFAALAGSPVVPVPPASVDDE